MLSVLRHALWILFGGSVGVIVWFLFSAWPEWSRAIAGATALACIYLLGFGMQELWKRRTPTLRSFQRINRHLQKAREEEEEERRKREIKFAQLSQMGRLEYDKESKQQYVRINIGEFPELPTDSNILATARWLRRRCLIPYWLFKRIDERFNVGTFDY